MTDQFNVRHPLTTLAIAIVLLFSSDDTCAQPTLREKIGQMVMITVTGDSVEDRNPSMDTLKSDLANGIVGGLVMYTWSGNLNNPGQILHLTRELQRRARIPLFLAVDEEGGRVARLGAANGFAATPSAYQMGTVVNRETYTRTVAATMAGWFVQTGLNMNLAPVVDVNVNPASPAIGALDRSFSANPESVALHAGWFIDEFRKRNVVTALKHFPGHGSAASDSHLGFTDVTTTWTSQELIPYTRLISTDGADVIMAAHVFNATIDPVRPASLSAPTITGLLRHQLGYRGVVISDAMGMKAISSLYGMDPAMQLAAEAGIDILLYTTNLDSAGRSLAAHIVNIIESSVLSGRISEARIDSSYRRILALKNRLATDVALFPDQRLPRSYSLVNYPNPFNPGTTIRYSLPKNALVTLGVYDILGREISLLVNERRAAGVYEVYFDGSALASGIYFCRLQTEEFIQTMKLSLLK